jgi:hypothetical protein
MTRSFKNGSFVTVPGVAFPVAEDCMIEKITNSIKQRLQIKVNLEKKEINFINIQRFEKLSPK